MRTSTFCRVGARFPPPPTIDAPMRRFDLASRMVEIRRRNSVRSTSAVFILVAVSVVAVAAAASLRGEEASAAPPATRDELKVGDESSNRRHVIRPRRKLDR